MSKLKKKNRGVPLIGQKFIYVGKDNECHKSGETYRVIGTGYHWIREYGFVVWMTTEHYKNTCDIDYGMAMSASSFNGNFKSI